MSSHHTVLHHEHSLPHKEAGTPAPLWVKVVSAGAGACIAEVFTFPLDTTKVRLQVRRQWSSFALHGVFT